MDKIRVAIVGLRFGGCFPPIYLDHTNVETVGICDTDERVLEEYGNKFNIKRRHNNIEEILSSNEYNAVHIVTPLSTHADLSVKILNSGKNCACTVPAGLSIEELEAIVKAQKKSRKNYMMMETAVYTYQCFYAKELFDSGKMGRIQLLKGTHYQDLEGWPKYWQGLPPMWYMTHAIAPLLLIADAKAVKVHCFGSGYMRKELVKKYNNPYPAETAIFQLDKKNLCAETTRSLFHVARSYVEGFSVYGEKMSFEWSIHDEEPVIYKMLKRKSEKRGSPVEKTRIFPPSYEKYLPKSIRKYSAYNKKIDPENPHKPIMTGAGHEGSHPHMVHEFVRSIVEKRPPLIDAVRAANWTAAGICAHESAMKGGKEVTVPDFGR